MSTTLTERLKQKIPVGRMRDLVPVGPAYPVVGPNQATLRQPINAPAATVFRFLEDDDVWRVLGVDIEWTSVGERGPGATRTVRLQNHTIEERFLVWEPGRRMVFRFERCTLPVRAFAESWGVEPTGDDRGDDTCDVVWSTAFDWAGRGGAAASGVFRAVFSAGGRRSLRKLRDLVESGPDRFGG